jgi:diaminopimelate epimerase
MRIKKIDFTKVVASGNDFVVVEKDKISTIHYPLYAKKLCDRKFGVGADGLLILEKSKVADIKMRIFNPDGS